MKNNEQDTRKITEIYQRYKQQMYSVAYGILENHYDAEDAVHNAVMAIMRHLDAISDTAEKDCRYYVLTAVRNISYNMVRDRRIVPDDMTELEVASDENIQSEYTSGETCDLIYSAISGMSPPVRDVLILNMYYDMKLSEIADLLDLNINTVKARAARGKQKLREIMKENGYG